MRKIIQAYGTFYYPEQYLNLIDTEELKIIVENPAGYVEGDSVRMFYTFETNNIQVGVNTFEMFSPLVKDGAILRAIFYLPLSADFANDRTFQSTSWKRTEFFIKAKGSTDFDYAEYLHKAFSFIYLMNSSNAQSNPIPVFFFSERGAGLFENTILNRQLRVADTNFSSVAIRQDKFCPYDMETGGRNLILKSDRYVQSSAYIIAGYDLSEDIVQGETYTMTIKGDINSGQSFRTLYNPNLGGGTRLTYDPQKGLYFGTFTASRPTDPGYIKKIYVYNDPQSSAENATIEWIKLEKGTIATAWIPNPKDYEVAEIVSGADLAGGLAKFDSSYAFKLLDDSEWVTKKLVCPEDYIQLFWGEPRSETRFSFWFKIKEIEKSSEAWGEVEHYRELRAGTDVKEMRKEVTKYRFPKTKLRLSSGVFRQDIIDKLKGIVHSPTIYKYNPYTKLNEGRGVIAQVTKLERVDGVPITQLGTGHFKLNYPFTYSNTIEELINSPESVFDLEFTVKGYITSVYFRQNRDDSSSTVLISDNINEADFTKKTFNASITIDRSMKVKPVLMFSDAAPFTEIKDIYIKGSLGGIEDVEVEIATMNIIPHQDGEGEMELTVISDDFRKPDYLYF